MSKFNLKGFVDGAVKAVSNHSPEILVGLGIVGMASGTITGIALTPKALRDIEREKDIIEQETGERPEKLPFKRLVKATWKYYVPVIAMELVSGACVIGASSINLKRNAALMTAYTLSETARKEYAEKVVETVGEKKEQTIRDALAKDKMEKHPVQNQEPIITGNGHTLCYDRLTDRYFRSDIESIRRAANNFNKELLRGQYLRLNDLYVEIGIPEAKVGDILGWSPNNGMIDVDFSSQLATDGTPCLVMSFNPLPKVSFNN